MGKGYDVLKEYWGNSFGLPNQGAINFVEMLWKEYGKKKKQIIDTWRMEQAPYRLILICLKNFDKIYI